MNILYAQPLSKLSCLNNHCRSVTSGNHQEKYIMSQAHWQHPMEPTVRWILPEEMLLVHAIAYLISVLELIQDSDKKEVCLYQV